MLGVDGREKRRRRIETVQEQLPVCLQQVCDLEDEKLRWKLQKR